MCMVYDVRCTFTAQTKLMAEKGKIDNRPPTQAVSEFGIGIGDGRNLFTWDI